MHHAGGMVLPPVQTLVATIIMPVPRKDKNANRVLSSAPEKSIDFVGAFFN